MTSTLVSSIQQRLRTNGTLVVFFSLFTVCIAYATVRGAVVSSDGVWYASAGDSLLAHHFNLPFFYRTHPTTPPVICYTTLVVLIAAAKGLSSLHWMRLMLLMNAAATATAGAVVFRLARRFFCGVAPLVSVVFFVASFDMIDLSRYLLTDAIFLGVSALAFDFMSTAVIGHDYRHFLYAMELTILALLTRPVAPILIVPMTAAAFALRERPFGIGHAAARLRRLAFWIALITPLVAVLAVMTLNVASRTGAVSTPWVAELVHQYQSGVVVIGRPVTSSSGGSDLMSFLYTLVARAAAFGQFITPSFSTAHKILSALYFVPLYGLALCGLASLAQPGRFRSSEGDVVVSLGAISLTTFWAFHAMVIIDYDWRYRLPVMPGLILLASAGAEWLYGMARHHFLRSSVPSEGNFGIFRSASRFRPGPQPSAGRQSSHAANSSDPQGLDEPAQRRTEKR